MKLGALFFIPALLIASVAVADDLSTYKVSFKTLACDGTKGFATIDSDKLDKIHTIKCDKADVIKEVYQVLVLGETGSGLKYRVFTTSEVEAEKIMKLVNAYQESKRKSIEDSGRIIINRVR
ncbi:hypothetical protein MNBD_NITROSPINAE01-1416 [hydrothermal vent metagenome]|uniref:Uncharacterized protein n=1 Tax=hydrothermal vent metagenome TaxID=652676 RepID=A0A3B1BT49_9ZZZZ